MTEPQEPPPPGYPPGYPPVPPQGYPSYGYQGYGAPGYGPGYGPPPGHLGWAIVAVLCFWPIGIAAFIIYAQIDRDYNRGDLAGAQRASRLVRKLGIIAPIVLVAVFVLSVATAWIALRNTY